MSSDSPTFSDRGYPDHLDLEYPDGNSDDESLAVLEDIVETSGSVRAGRVLERARGDVGRSGASAHDYQFTLQKADGELALISWSNAYIAIVGYVGGDRPEYDCYSYSKICEQMRGPEAATTYERWYADDVREEFRDRDPLVVLRDRTALADRGAE